MSASSFPIRGPFFFALLDEGRLHTTKITTRSSSWAAVLTFAAKELNLSVPLCFIEGRPFAAVADAAAGPTLSECIEARKAKAIGFAELLRDEAVVPPNS